jgi:hypothetical protein
VDAKLTRLVVLRGGTRGRFVPKAEKRVTTPDYFEEYGRSTRKASTAPREITLPISDILARLGHELDLSRDSSLAFTSV